MRSVPIIPIRGSVVFPHTDTLLSFVRRGSVVAADEASTPIYDTLVVVQIALANAVNDYVFNIINPFDSITVKSFVREQVCRDIFGLEANF